MNKSLLFATIHMMKLLGIDYGTKRIGLATADTDTAIATPLDIIDNNGDALKRVVKVCEHKDIDTVVIGESVDRSGNENPVMEHAKEFAAELINTTEADIAFFDEFNSTMQASQQPGNASYVDGSAAAVILQRFLYHEYAQDNKEDNS
jgi:putative Holliday junction resolvase